MAVTNDELRAMIERLADTKIRFAAEDERQATIRMNATTDEAAVMLRSILAEREKAIDKIDGLQTDLDIAIAVMRRRVSGEASVESMGEWLDLNYPVKGEAP